MSKYWLLFIIILIIAIGLRIYKLDIIPPSLNWDEAAIAWNGYSIGQTHLDEYGTKFPLVFRSFGDYKAPGLIYILAVLSRIFGLSVWTVRLPVALAGISVVVLCFLLAKEIGRLLKLSKEEKQMYPILSMGLIALNAWGIFFSRGAFEAMLALSLTMFGTWIWLLSLRKIYFLPLSLLSFLGAMYSYHSPKIFIPLFVIVLLALFAKKFILNISRSKLGFIFTIIGMIVFIYFAIPLLRVSLLEKGSGRLDTSIFYDDKNQIKSMDFGIVIDFFKNYISHLDPRFLLTGDRLNNFRTELKFTGKLNLIEYSLLIVGIIYLIKVKNKMSKMLIWWLLIGIVPAAIGKEVPHAIRSLNMLPAIVLISALGLLVVMKKIKKYKIHLFLGLLLYLLQFGLFIKDYFFQFSVYAAPDWQYGMKQVTATAKQYENQVAKIIITNQYGQPHVLTYVYQEKDPVDVIYGLMGQKYQFRKINWEGDQFCQNCLLIGSPTEIDMHIPHDRGELIQTIYFPDGSVAFNIIKTK